MTSSDTPRQPHPPSDPISIAPSLNAIGAAEQIPPPVLAVDRRVLQLCLTALILGAVTGGVAQLLVHLIGLITNLAFYGHFSFHEASPAPAVERLGLWVIPIPVVGAILVGLMARFGSKAIRGHGIPEAMEQVLTNESRIPARITLLKPVSAAISIGTGGPFGAEGPIIATGGALGSLVGQLRSTSASERKTLLAAGAAAGMSAIFGTPVSAVLLAIELLLFEFRARSMIPVALAASIAAGVRMILVGPVPPFQMTELAQPTGAALLAYILIGGLMGIAAVVVTRLTYGIEDAFEKLPIHWMWWPAIGAVAVGTVGYFAPTTLGVGYSNISDLLSARLTLSAALFLCVMKFLSWSISLGSGTSGGTLAPLLTIGGAMGTALGIGLSSALPGLGIDPRIAALVGMASLFAGASRATLASAVFMFEATMQPAGLLPLLGACATANLVSSYFMTHSIMTEKIARRGIRTPAEYEADALDQVFVRNVCSSGVTALKAEDSVQAVRDWLASGVAGTSHQGFPVLDEHGTLVGVLTRRNLVDPAVPGEQTIRQTIRMMPKYVYDDCTVRQAADHMVNHGIGRLPVVSRTTPPRVIGMITRSDVLSVFKRRAQQQEVQEPTLRVRVPTFRLKAAGRKRPARSEKSASR